MEGVPNTGTVFNGWPDYGFECDLFHVGVAGMKISLQETQCSASLASDSVDVRFPTKIMGDVYTQVGATGHSRENAIIKNIIESNGILFSGYRHCVTLGNIEFKEPFILPQMQVVEVILKETAITGRTDLSIEDAVISKQADLGGNLLREIINVQEEE